MKKLGWVILDADGDLADESIYYRKSDAIASVFLMDGDRSHYHAPYSTVKVYLKTKNAPKGV